MDDVSERYLDYGDLKRVPSGTDVMVECHRPKPFVVPYHHHASIEVNFMTDCAMDYSFSGIEVVAPTGRPVVFWGAMPHCVTAVRGKGQTVNIYIGLAQLLGWQLPDDFIDALICGDVLCAGSEDPLDALQFARWAGEFPTRDTSRRALIAGEVEMRLRRFAMSPWIRLKPGSRDVTAGRQGTTRMRYIEEMVRYIADNYASPITVVDVADHVNLSQNYAMTLFRRVIGVPIKEHITRIRLSHAQMLLSSTEMKILSVAMDSGFGSLSAFYDAFQSRTGKSPATFRRETHRSRQVPDS